MSRSEIPDWVRVACGRWGRQKRRIWAGCDWHGNVDGYAQSLLGRIRDERDGAGQGVRTQHWPEVFWGEGLDVQRSLSGIAERQFGVLHAHYVWDPEWQVSVARKATLLELKRTEYFSLLEVGETWIHARLDVLAVPDSQLVEQVSEIVQKALQSGGGSAINSHTRQNSPPPRLNLDALQRQQLTLKRG